MVQDKEKNKASRLDKHNEPTRWTTRTNFLSEIRKTPENSKEAKEVKDLKPI